MRADRLIVCALLALFALLAGCRPIQPVAAPPAATLELIDRIGGPSLAVAVQDHYAYVSFSREFAVLDIRDPHRPQRVAYVPLPTHDLALEGAIAYVVGKSGLSWFDIRRPTQPIRLGFFATRAGLTSVAVDAGLVYAVRSRDGQYIVDVTNPNASVALSFTDLPGHTQDIAVAGDYAYLATSTGLTVWEIRDRRQPRLVGSNPAPGWAQAIAIQDDVAYLVSDAAVVTAIDISDPAQPQTLDQLALAGYADDVQVVGDIAYIANGLDGLRLINVADPHQLRLVGALPNVGMLNNLAIVGDIAYATDLFGGGLHLLDIADHDQLGELHYHRTPGLAASVSTYRDRVYVAAGMPSTLFVLAHAAGDMTHLGQVAAASPASSHLAAPGLAHPVMAHTRGGDLTMMGAYAMPGELIYDVSVDAHCACLFAASGEDGAVMIDATDPSQLSQLAHLSFEGDIQRAIFDNERVYLIDGWGALRIVDLAMRSAPAQIGAYAGRTPGAIAVVDVVVQNGYAYLASGRAGLQVLDVRNPAHIERIGVLATPHFARRLVLVGHFLYLALGDNVLAVVDISNPRAPRQVGQVTLGGAVTDLALQDDYLYLAIEGQGLSVVNVMDALQPVVVAQIDNVDDPRSVAIAGNTIYLAAGHDGVLVYHFVPPAAIAVP